MSKVVSEEIRANAEIYHGHEICKEKSQLLLMEMKLPNGLLPLEDIEECGYVEATGFVWMKQKKKCSHKFEKVGNLVSYDTFVSGYAEQRKMGKLTGVKVREFLIWITLTEFHVDDPPTGKISFKSATGISKSFPVSAFEVEEKIVLKESNGEKEVAAAVVQGMKEV